MRISRKGCASPIRVRLCVDYVICQEKDIKRQYETQKRESKKASISKKESNNSGRSMMMRMQKKSITEKKKK